MTDARRVVLLARPGPACERMRAALVEAGARVVLEADPLALAQEALVAAAPQVVLVVLDPATEDVIDRFETVLADPAIEVIFEEADLAASREGWDAARWVRHLAAKLNRHDNVLPPGREADGGDASAAPGTAPSPAPAAAPLLEATLAAPAAPVPARPALALVDDDAFAAPPPPAPALPPVPPMPAPAAVVPPPLPWELDAIPDQPVAVAAREPAPASSLSLADDAAPPAPADPGIATESDPEADRRFQRDLADLELRIAEMEQVEPSAPTIAAPAGAVIVLAGIGGPDAVRQLLGALPSGFARPVLVHQRLDGGRYDKLVAQMQRATPLPVRLAESGQAVQAGAVYIVPPAVGVAATGSAGLAFTDAGADPLATVPAPDSAVLMLSGSDPALVAAAMNLSWGGALVAAQALDGCYDAAAPSELIARGAVSGSPTELARRLAERWPS